MYKKMVFRIVVFFIIFAICFWLIPGIIINKNKTIIIGNSNINNIEKNIYNVADLYKMSKNKTTVELKIKNQIIFTDICEIDIDIINFDNSEYNINLYVDDIKLEKEEVQNIQKDKYIKLTSEGEHNIKIQIEMENDIIAEDIKKVYYIKPYEKQFLDEFSNDGTIVHYLNGSWEKYEKTADLLINCGIKSIRTTFSWEDIEKDNENDIFNFDYYDKWIEKLTNNDINIIACFNRIAKYSGEDGIINNEKEKEEFLKFAKEVIKRYPQIKNYEFINEPNLNNQYITDEDISWYATILKELSEIDGINIITGGTNTPDEDSLEGTKSSTFFKQLFNNNVYEYCDNYAYHPYDSYINKVQNERFYMKLDEHNNIFQNEGGFANQYVTEYGIHLTDLEEQANRLIQQAVILDKYNIKYSMQYNFWNTGKDLGNVQNNYGLINYDYSPKPAYYAMKNFLTNTNGAEYIGDFDLVEGLEAHIYDKDGKPIIITWAENSDKNIEIEYKNFVAKDTYGKEIKADKNGKTVVTTSPVYLYEVDYRYYYKAISKVVTEKYQEFEEKFANQILKLPKVQDKITQMKVYMQNVGKSESKILEESSIKAMEMHYEIGRIILQSYKNKTIEEGTTKLSSMLDMLNDIGNSYEDLVTISAIKRKYTLEETRTMIEETERYINNNSDLEIIYPQKILKFSKELYEKAKYINSLQEKNDIKTGLIISKNLHAKYLSQWSKEFAEIYIEEYIKSNPITETYSATNLTNQDVTVTLNIGTDVKITNNLNSNMYTFKENGKFTFEYERRGKKLKKTVEVTNIDKLAPKVINLVNNKVYNQAIMPTIEDENIENIQLILNGQIIESYKSGDKIEQPGEYKLIATDKAGNKVEFHFYIITENYQNVDNKIINIKQQTTLIDFKKHLKLDNIKYYEILRDGKILSNNDIICTGDILQNEKGIEYILIVAGDIDKDGKVTVNDYSMLRLHILRLKEFDDIEIASADVDVDLKNISVADYSKMRDIILKNI